MAYAISAVLGILWALVLKRLKPETYQAIGLGADASTGRADVQGTGEWQSPYAESDRNQQPRRGF